MKKFLFAFILVSLMSGASSSFGAEGFLWIGGNDCEEPYVLDSDCSGTGWTWETDSATLSLNSSYTGEPVYIYCYETTTLDITDNVTINGGEFGSPLRCDGDFNITGSGTLNLVPSEFAEEYSLPALSSPGNITFSGANIIANSEGELNSAVMSEYGDIILTGNAKVTVKAEGVQGYAIYSGRNLTLEGNSELTAEGEGTNASGVIIKSGDITVNDNAKFTAIGKGEGYALDIRQGNLVANNDNVKLIADDEEHYSTQENSGTGEIETETEPEKSPETGTQTLHSSSGGCNSALLIWAALALVIMKYIAQILKVHSK